jgi:hypothetical protein
MEPSFSGLLEIVLMLQYWRRGAFNVCLLKYAFEFKEVQDSFRPLLRLLQEVINLTRIVPMLIGQVCIQLMSPTEKNTHSHLFGINNLWHCWCKARLKLNLYYLGIGLIDWCDPVSRAHMTKFLAVLVMMINNLLLN